MNESTLASEVARLHAYLPAHGLVSWSTGNISARVSGSRLMVIKPSGVLFEELEAGNMCKVDIDSLECPVGFKPSSDTATHAYIYKHMPEVGGIVHTHSPYATAWAALGREIPCFLTEMADEFGGPVPCGGFAMIGGEEIGREVVRVLSQHRSPVTLLQNHGVFAIGKSPLEAVKAAVMCESVARTAFLAHQLGEPKLLAPEDIDRLHERYKTDYGQRKNGLQ